MKKFEVWKKLVQEIPKREEESGLDEFLRRMSEGLPTLNLVIVTRKEIGAIEPPKSPYEIILRGIEQGLKLVPAWAQHYLVHDEQWPVWLATEPLYASSGELRIVGLQDGHTISASVLEEDGEGRWADPELRWVFVQD